jgi:DNA-binding response OmpR family regulator
VKETADAPKNKKPIKQTRKILLIDDNKTVSGVLTEYLTIIGYDCTTANNGREGIKLLKQQPYDVVLLDLVMPKFSGLDVLGSLKKEGLMKKQKIILLTASSITDEQINKLQKTGVRSFLRKPFDIDMVVEKIEQVHNSE